MSKTPWVVIPTYNEKDNISAMIMSLAALRITNLQILIVDDNSPDGTADIVRDLQKQHPSLHLLVRQKKDGLGQAYVHGFSYAIQHSATAVVQMDADFSHDPADVPRLLSNLEEANLVIGSRYSHGISVINWPLRRLLLSISANTYARLITGLPFKDVTAGFRAWRSETLQTIDFTSIKDNGYAFHIITMYRAHKKGARIIEIPITFTERREGQSKMSRAIMKEGIWIVWRLRLFGK